MEPMLKPRDKHLFYSFLDAATEYFEFGSGGSTYQASLRPNITTIHTVESDLEWISKLKTLITHPSINYNLIDIQARPKSLGYPGPKCGKELMKKYSSVAIPPTVDFVLIDGRFRVACCLKLFSAIKDSTTVAFDDFLNRRCYRIVLDYYSILYSTADKSLVILRKKECEPPSSEIIGKYEIDPR
jgi:hypothetical protein